MTDVFKDYAAYYDLIYRDKLYNNEVEYVHNLIQKLNPGSKTILDLGCGTGIHANLLAAKGYVVVGIDFSTEMIEIANSKRKTDYAENANRLNFFTDDIRTVELNQKFDVVLSLFHVFSYLNHNHDVKAGINTIDKHLKDFGGVAIFDFWYGPGVLTDLPVIREKHFESERIRIKRLATPQLKPDENVVDVNYSLEIEELDTNLLYFKKEIHSMRYFFLPELELFLEPVSKLQIEFHDWLSYESPTLSSWAACVTIKR